MDTSERALLKIMAHQAAELVHTAYSAAKNEASQLHALRLLMDVVHFLKDLSTNKAYNKAMTLVAVVSAVDSHEPVSSVDNDKHMSLCAPGIRKLHQAFVRLYHSANPEASRDFPDAGLHLNLAHENRLYKSEMRTIKLMLQQSYSSEPPLKRQMSDMTKRLKHHRQILLLIVQIDVMKCS